MWLESLLQGAVVSLGEALEEVKEKVLDRELRDRHGVETVTD
jgi:hypothetical protein